MVYSALMSDLYTIFAFRLGVNFNQLQVNRPLNKVIANSYKDGHMNNDNDGGMPNYNPNSFLKASTNPLYKESPYLLDSVIVDRHEPPNDNFFQVSINLVFSILFLVTFKLCRPR